jgi:hypothetical protein
LKQENANLIRTDIYLSVEQRKALSKLGKGLKISMAAALRLLLDKHFGLATTPDSPVAETAPCPQSEQSTEISA